MSQVEKEVVNSPGEVVKLLGSGFHASTVLSQHQPTLEHTVIITTSHSPLQSQQEGGHPASSPLTAKAVCSCNLGKY